MVITSSESASSIETQFETVATQLERSIECVNVMLDEKKCGNMKQTIEFIQEKLRVAFDLARADTKDRTEDVEMETKKVTIRELSSSESERSVESEEDEEHREGMRQSNVISSIQEPSFYLAES